MYQQGKSQVKRTSSTPFDRQARQTRSTTGVETIRTTYCDCAPVTTQLRNRYTLIACPFLARRQAQTDSIPCRIAPPPLLPWTAQHTHVQHSKQLTPGIIHAPLFLPLVIDADLTRVAEIETYLVRTPTRPNFLSSARHPWLSRPHHQTDNQTLLQPQLGTFLAPMEACSGISRHFS